MRAIELLAALFIGAVTSLLDPMLAELLGTLAAMGMVYFLLIRMKVLKPLDFQLLARQSNQHKHQAQTYDV